MKNCVYFRAYDDKMILYTINQNHVVQKVRDADGKVYEYVITLGIFEQLKKELNLWQINI